MKCICGMEFQSENKRIGHVRRCPQWEEYAREAAREYLKGSKTLKETSKQLGVSTSTITRYAHVTQKNGRGNTVAKVDSSPSMEATPDQIISAIEGLIARTRRLEQENNDLRESLVLAERRAGSLAEEIERGKKGRASS